MLKIYIPDNNTLEREYIINILFLEFLGLNFDILIDQSISYYSICFGENEIVIRDHFFKYFPSELTYINKDALPTKLDFVKNEFIIENNIPVIYGTDEILITGNKILCGIDIFASSFFMLTRWEEYVTNVRDVHSRFPGTESIAYKHGFLDRPIVNEYAEMLWKMLMRLGYSGDRKLRSFELFLTHDIDHLDYPNTCRIVLGDILKRKKIELARDHIKHYLTTGSNPYDTFDFIM
jgi:hypothetical protein